MGIYVLIAIVFEERNLIEFHGRRYAEYRRAVPALVPFTMRRKSAPAAAEVAIVAKEV